MGISARGNSNTTPGRWGRQAGNMSDTTRVRRGRRRCPAASSIARCSRARPVSDTTMSATSSGASGIIAGAAELRAVGDDDDLARHLDHLPLGADDAGCCCC